VHAAAGCQAARGDWQGCPPARVSLAELASLLLLQRPAGAWAWRTSSRPATWRRATRPPRLPWLGVGSGRREAASAVHRAPGCALRLRLGIPDGVALRCCLKAPAWARQSRLRRAGRLASAGDWRLALHPSAFVRLAGVPYACLAADGRCTAPAARWRLCFALAGLLPPCCGAAERLLRAARRAGAAGTAGECCTDDERVRGRKAGCSSGGSAVAGGSDSTCQAVW
jgi:hypothetical protein